MGVHVTVFHIGLGELERVPGFLHSIVHSLLVTRAKSCPCSILMQMSGPKRGETDLYHLHTFYFLVFLLEIN